jgi:putative transposase
MIDLYNGEVISWSVSMHPNMELVISMLDKALNKLQEHETPIIHLGSRTPLPKKSICRYIRQ